MSNSPRPVWQTRALRWSAGIVAVLLLLALISWLALPPLVKNIAIEQTQQKIGRKLSIGEVRFNPFRLALTIDDVVLYEADQTTPALRARQLLINASSTSLPRMAAVLDEIKLVAPELHLVRLSADGIGRYNFTDVLERIQAMPKSDSKTYFSLSNIQLQNGAIRFDDKVTGKTIDIRALTIGVPALSNLPRNADTYVQPQLSMTVNGTPFALKGRSKPFANSLDTTLAIDIDHLDLVSYLPFVPVALPLQLQSAKLSSRLDLSFSRNQQQPQITLDGLLSLNDLALQDQDHAPLLKAAAVNVHIGKLDLLKLDGSIDQIEIEQPQIWAAMNRRGQLNWARLGNGKQAQPKAASTAASSATTPAAAHDDAAQGLPAITLHKLTVRDGSINWNDQAHATPAAQIKLGAININAEEISTRANAAAGKLNLSATENGHGSIGFDGELAPVPASLNGQLTLKAIQLDGYQAYLDGLLAARLSGQLSGQARLQLAGSNVQLDQTSLQLEQLKLSSGKHGTTTSGTPGSKGHTGSKSGKAGKINNSGNSNNDNSLLAAKSIALDNAAIDLQKRTASADAFRIAGLDGNLQRNADGSFNLQQLLLTSTTPSPAQAATTPAGKTAAPATAAAWQARLRNLAISDSSLSYTDLALSPRQPLRLSGFNLKLDNLSTQLDQTSHITLQTTLNNSGKLQVSGQAAPQLKNLELNLDAASLPLAPFQAYFTDYLNVTLTSGTLSSKGKLQLTPPLKQQKLALQYNGAASINNFRILDKSSANDFLRWRALDVQGIHAKVSGQTQVTLDKIALSNFYARAILSEQGKLNLQDILVHKQPDAATTVPDSNAAAATPASTTVAQTTTSAAPVTPAAAAPNAPIIRIGQTVLQDGNINFTDNFVKPNYTANMTGMSGTIGSIASDQAAPASIALHGKIDNDAPLEISGSLNPLFKPMFLDVKATANGIQLPRLTPYSAKYAGYPITKGKLTMDVQYKIESEKLVAQNNIRIEQLTFGDHVDGPSVTKLPVMLAISLLKDRDGNINLDLPVSGSLSDPQFSIGSIIMRVFTNLIVKAVTSPFALISSMFGGSDNLELSYIEFKPGSAELTDDIRKKLDTLGYALHQRPALKIDIMGRVDPAADDAGLRQAILERKMRALKRKDLIAQQGQVNRDELTLSDADRSKYLEKVYADEKFKKPRNVIGFAKSLPAEEMQKLIIDNTQISEDDLRTLAQQRADLVRNYLQEQSTIAAERIFLIAPKLNTDGIKDKGSGSRAELTLEQ